MKHHVALAAIALQTALIVPMQADVFVVSGDPQPAASTIQGRARNGGSGFEGVLFTPQNPSPPGVSMNPGGAPVWSPYGRSHNFSLQYTAATGTAVWSVDFSADGDFGDSQEVVTSTSAGLAGKGFEYVNLLVQGSSDPDTATVNGFTINGTNFGNFTSPNDTALNSLFENVLMTDGNITATGTLAFSGGQSSERPRVWVQLYNPSAISAVPEPSSVLLLGTLVAGVTVAFRRKARKV